MKTLPLVVALLVLACHRAPAPSSAEPAGGVTGGPVMWTMEGHEPAYHEYAVETRVRTVPGTPLPTYPHELQVAGVRGRVLVQFVVDTAGRAEAGTDTILESTDPAFSQAVLENLSRMRFYPATIGGKKVRQVVQDPFTFSIGP